MVNVLVKDTTHTENLKSGILVLQNISTTNYIQIKNPLNLMENEFVFRSNLFYLKEIILYRKTVETMSDTIKTI